MHEELKAAPFELKELSETGEFVGFASLYGNVDLGGDVVDPGAFTKSITQRGSKVRLMDGHKVRIGVATVEETPIGLKTYGKINIAKQSGLEAYSDLKFYQANGMPMGMSIGYETIQADPAHLTKDGARHLKEVRLWEVTVTEFAMNEKAQVVSVKALSDLIASVKENRTEQKDDFVAELQEIQLYAARYQMLQALSCSLSTAIYDVEVTDKVGAAKTYIQQFMDAYLAVLPDYLALMADQSMEWMSRPGFEQKAGRVLSAANRNLVEKCVTDLQALLDAADAAEGTTKSGPPNGAAEKSDEGERQSAVTAQLETLKGASQWN